MFAGPNGSGKSTLIDEVKKDYYVGYFVNADEIERELKSTKFLDLTEFTPKTIKNELWEEFFYRKKEIDSRINESFPQIKLKDNILTYDGNLDSYHCSIIAEFLRFYLLENDITFSFETVMSHDSKVNFLKLAKEKGFKTYLYFICTQDYKINLQRILNRVKKGGHDVNPEKTIQRYYRSLELLYDAFMQSDRAFIIDSSNENREVIVEKDKSNVSILKENVPEWISKYLLGKIEINQIE